MRMLPACRAIEFDLACVSDKEDVSVIMKDNKETIIRGTVRRLCENAGSRTAANDGKDKGGRCHVQYQISKGSKAYGAICRLPAIFNLKYSNNEKIAVVGRNGCGKTTLLRRSWRTAGIAGQRNDSQRKRIRGSAIWHRVYLSK